MLHKIGAKPKTVAAAEGCDRLRSDRKDQQHGAD